MRYFFEIQYKGTHYHGWQIQANAETVQSVITECMQNILGTQVKIEGSSRTDTGVHARQQFFHTDLDEIDTGNLRLRLNSVLPADISINQISAMADEAHSRFDAVSRTYEYRILRRKDPFAEETGYFYSKSLDIDHMNRLATELIGKRDFQCFSKVKTDVNNFICNVTFAEWKEENYSLNFVITANRFLRGMVRSIVGTLLLGGEGKLSLDDLRAILKSRDRRKAGRSAPAKGLTLMRVEYPEDILS